MMYQDHKFRQGYQRTMRVPGPFEREERPLRFQYIAAPVIGTLAWLLMVAK
jgi:hypothetical protein